MSQIQSARDRRVIAIGDIHGCAKELRELLMKVAPSRDDLVIFLGDYVDRGPDSRAVIDQILETQVRCEVISLMGNHEQMFLDFLENPDSVGAGLFILNGGAATLARYAVAQSDDGAYVIPQDHLTFVRSLKVFVQSPEHLFVHAGVPTQKLDLSFLDPDADKETCLWTRGAFLTQDIPFSKTVVHGHTPQMRPDRRARRVNIDTGCVFGGALTAYDVSLDRFISVSRQGKSAVGEMRDEALGDQLLARRYQNSRVAVRFNGRMPVFVGKRGELRHSLTTLNYNQFGLLLIQRPEDGTQALFEVGDRLDGSFGNLDHRAVAFEGEVTRIESREGLMLYGVKLEQVSAELDSNQSLWIARPPGGGVKKRTG